MIQLKNKETGSLIGSISQDDLQFLIDNLEEEWEEDTDYYLNRATLDMLKKNGMKVAPPSSALTGELQKIGKTMTDEWAKQAGEDGAAILDAYRK